MHIQLSENINDLPINIAISVTPYTIRLAGRVGVNLTDSRGVDFVVETKDLFCHDKDSSRFTKNIITAASVYTDTEADSMIRACNVALEQANLHLALMTELSDDEKALTAILNALIVSDFDTALKLILLTAGINGLEESQALPSTIIKCMAFNNVIDSIGKHSASNLESPASKVVKALIAKSGSSSLPLYDHNGEFDKLSSNTKLLRVIHAVRRGAKLNNYNTSEALIVDISASDLINVVTK